MLRKWLPHVAILLSNMYLVFYVIDRFNRAMAFINNDLTKGLLVGLSLVSIFNSCLLIHDRRERIRAAQRRAGSARRTPPTTAPVQRPAPKTPPVRSSAPQGSISPRRTATQVSPARRSAPLGGASTQRPTRRPALSSASPLPSRSDPAHRQ